MTTEIAAAAAMLLFALFLVAGGVFTGVYQRFFRRSVDLQYPGIGSRLSSSGRPSPETRITGQYGW
jgi:hypothetical protein